MSSILAGIFQIVQAIFCSGGSNNNQQNQQNQQHGQQQQQQYQQQQSGYPGQNQNTYPPQQQQQPTPHQQPYKPSGNVHVSTGGYGQAVGPYVKMDANQMNQSNDKYVAMRDAARKEGDLMAQCFQKSKSAYATGDGAAAHEFSVQGKQHQENKRRIDAEAKDWIYYQNNTDSPPGTIDLHGLYVKEAIASAETEIQKAQGRGDREIKFIVGKGNHSQSHVSKIKPAIEDLMEKYNLDAHLDPQNSGVLVVNLQAGGSGGRQRGRAFGNELENKSGGSECVIM